jgi:cytochrome c oxidase assembly protein subunit 15
MSRSSEPLERTYGRTPGPPWTRALERWRRFTITPQQYTRVAYVALGALTLIVLTGAAVRLTGSGLGCPDWPSCYGKGYPPLRTHAVIEFSNRTLTAPVSLAALAAWMLAYRRRPYRRDLARLALLLPLGVLAQAVLGGLTVDGKLAYGWVMAHFALSMLLLAAAWVLVWRASREPLKSALQTAPDRGLLWGARALVGLGALTIFAGTAATAAGPHAGGEPGQPISRLTFDGHGTMGFVIHRHAELAILFGLAAVGLWAWARYLRASAQAQRALTAVCVLLAAQGVVGAVQYETHLPTELVWVHVLLACLSWIAVLWVNSAVSTPREPLSPQPLSGIESAVGQGANAGAARARALNPHAPASA